MSDNLFFDAHFHIFSIDQIPMSPALRGNVGHIGDVLKVLGIHDVARFIDDGDKPSWQVLSDIMGCYLGAHAGQDLHHVLVPLMMDFGLEYEGDHYLFEWQLEDLLKLKKAYPDNLLPFFAYDINRPLLRRDVSVDAVPFGAHTHDVFLPKGTSLDDVVTALVGEDKPFRGIKLYPSFGYYPDNTKLDWIYGLCERQSIPITTHCSNDHGLAPKLVALVNGELDDFIRVERHWQHAVDPSYFGGVLRRFPKLHINLAHFGGTDEMLAYYRAKRAGDEAGAMSTWVGTILRLLRDGRYPNVYTDCAACVYVDKRYPGLLRQVLLDHPEIETRVMYGSDYYMTSMDIDRDDLQKRLRSLFWTKPGQYSFFNKRMSQRLTRDNPMRFLGVG